MVMSIFIIQLLFKVYHTALCVCVHVCVLCVLQSTEVFFLYFMWQTKISLLKGCLIFVCCCTNIFVDVFSLSQLFFFFLTIQNFFLNVWLSPGIEPRTTCLTHKHSVAELRQWSDNFRMLLFFLSKVPHSLLCQEVHINWTDRVWKRSIG